MSVRRPWTLRIVAAIQSLQFYLGTATTYVPGRFQYYSISELV